MNIYDVWSWRWQFVVTKESVYKWFSINWLVYTYTVRKPNHWLPDDCKIFDEILRFVVFRFFFFIFFVFGRWEVKTFNIYFTSLLFSRMFQKKGLRNCRTRLLWEMRRKKKNNINYSLSSFCVFSCCWWMLL